MPARLTCGLIECMPDLSVSIGVDLSMAFLCIANWRLQVPLPVHTRACTRGECTLHVAWNAFRTGIDRFVLPKHAVTPLFLQASWKAS